MGVCSDPKTEYKCPLTAETQAIAKEQLREDDNFREQALEQFREWISKHPSIKRCRTDAVFLLRFLRTKKFSLPLAQEMLERYLSIRLLHPDWFRNLDIEDPDTEAIIDAGYLVPLPKRDALGRKVLFTCIGRFDPYKYTVAQLIRVHGLVIEALLDDEESQVRGYTYINDQSGMTMSHLSAWTIADIRNMIKCVQHSSPMRHKETHFFNVPSFGMKITEFAISLLNDKLKSRVMFHRSVDELKDIMDPKILPKEYGGEVPVSEMVAEFKKVLKQKRDAIKALDEMYIEISPKEYASTCGEGLGGIAGSFRKLEVD